MKSICENRLLPPAAALVAIGLILCGPVRAVACPFCSAVSLTLSEEIAANDVAVIVRLIELPAHDDPADPSGSMARFEVVDVLKGEGLLGGAKKIDVIYFGQDRKDTLFYVLGTEPPNFNWTTPVRLSERRASGSKPRAYVSLARRGPADAPRCNRRAHPRPTAACLSVTGWTAAIARPVAPPRPGCRTPVAVSIASDAGPALAAARVDRPRATGRRCRRRPSARAFRTTPAS